MLPSHLINRHLIVLIVVIPIISLFQRGRKFGIAACKKDELHVQKMNTQSHSNPPLTQVQIQTNLQKKNKWGRGERNQDIFIFFTLFLTLSLVNRRQDKLLIVR